MSNLTIRCDGFDFSLFNPTQFRLAFNKIPHVPFFCQNISIPEVSMGTAVAASRWHDVNLPGEKLTFGTFTADILLDAKMVTYTELFSWMKNISVLNLSSDYTSFCQVHAGGNIFHFNDVFPISIGSLGLTKITQDSPGLTFTAVFNFTTFDIKSHPDYN